MFIAACRLTFALPGNRSLKGKRQVVRRVCDRLKHKFHATAAEVGDSERWSEAEIGFAMVSGNERKAKAMVENIVDYLQEMMIAPIRDAEFEIIKFDDIAMGESFGPLERWDPENDAKLGDFYENEE